MVVVWSTDTGKILGILAVCLILQRPHPPSTGPAQKIDAKFRSPVPAPWSVVKLWRVGPGIVTLMNMSCVAFMCHYNGVKYYEELEHRSVKKYAVTIG